MRDLNTRAMLIEAVIAGGLTAIGITTGQGPLVALVSAAAGVGTNWAYSLAERGFQHWRDRWFTDEGALNHDITKALCHAFEDAVRQVEHDWKEHHYYHYLQRNKPEEAKLTITTFRFLREDGANILQQPHQLAQLTQQEQRERVLSLIDQDKYKANEYLKSALDTFLYGHDAQFVSFVTDQFGPKWILRFLEILKDPGEEGTRAWRACQWLWQKSLMLGIDQLQQTTAETANTVRWLKEWAEQLQSQPLTQRNSTGQKALDDILSSLHTQLNGIQETLDKTYAATLDIKATVEHLYSKEVPANTVPTHLIWHVPYRRNPFFTGREVLLKNLNEQLHKNRNTALAQAQAITGLGGIGKTQIAIEYVYRYRDQYRAVLWARAATRDSLLADYAVIANLLHLEEADKHDPNIIVDGIKRWLNKEQNWLLVLDNADDIEMISQFLPDGEKGHILLTTRASAVGFIAEPVEVSDMDSIEGVQLLLRRARIDQPTKQDQANARLLVKEMGGLPLALDQVGAYIEETKSSLAQYMELYQTQQSALLNRKSKLSPDYSYTVATTWSLSFDQIKQHNRSATLLLSLCAFLSPDMISEELIIKGAPYLGSVLKPVVTNPLKLDEAIMELLRFSLLKRNSATRTLSLHRLVQEVLKSEMSEKTQHLWAERAVRVVNAILPEESLHRWEPYQQNLPHARLCQELIKQQKLSIPEAGRLLNKTAWYLGEQARYPEAELVARQALDVCMKALGSEHAETATAHNVLASAYYFQNQFEQARVCYQQALFIREKVLGPEHPDTAITLNNFAILQQDQGKFEEAESLIQRALSIAEKSHGTEHPETIITYTNLANLYVIQSKYEQAEPLLQKALSVVEKVYGTEDLKKYPIYVSLANLYNAQGKYEQAEPLYQKALSIAEKSLGPAHPYTGGMMSSLASTYQNQGKYEQAEPLFQRALSIAEKSLGPEHPATGDILSSLADLYDSQARYEQAEPLFLRALSIAEKSLGPENPTTGSNLTSLARTYQNLGKYEQAEPLFLRALNIAEKSLGSEHLETARTLHELARSYHGQHRYEEAEQLFKRALSIMEKILGPAHPSIATTLYRLAQLYEDQEKHELAEPLFQQSLNIREHELGPAHPSTKATIEDYAALLRRTRREKEAEALESRIKTE